ncbi:hypothetical protein P2G74_01340 [Cronobacter muytjensii]|uniref:hypothetical protein n=1 Tax=Cronobacter muytjensii TaxID=413501 RepID=UPI002DB7C2C7|nr:hypothetical protein [Cronobacter muytjensii]MEB8638617.1 hypothetical protein [Cronobacter muytjensii]
MTRQFCSQCLRCRNVEDLVLRTVKRYRRQSELYFCKSGDCYLKYVSGHQTQRQVAQRALNKTKY